MNSMAVPETVQDNIAVANSIPALWLDNVLTQHSWYLSASESPWCTGTHYSTPVAAAPLGRGTLGFVGSVVEHRDYVPLLLAMAGIEVSLQLPNTISGATLASWQLRSNDDAPA
jgi:hypothetical protein